MTAPYLTIGRKLTHSYSQFIHDAFGKYDFALKELEPDEARDFILHGTWKGITITIPYKKLAYELCDVLSPEAQEIGCANVVVRHSDNTLHGYNTDYRAFLYMAETAGISFQDKKVLVLGSGGTSLTTRTAAKNAGAREIVIVSRTGEVNYSNVEKLHSNANIIINATPVGMYPNTDAIPLNLDAFPNLSGVLDAVYNPMRTRLKQAAQKRNIPCGDGLRMLVAQAFYAMELFLDAKQDTSLIEDVREKVCHNTANIVLIGMPGCGKTTLGKTLAQKLNRVFIDTDEEIVRRTGCSIQKIFATQGESTFRQIEAEVIRDVCREKQLVIATGGGAILTEENRLNIRQNGYVLYLDKPLDTLELGNGRPLSTSHQALQQLYATRHPLYQSTADYTISNLNEIPQSLLS